MSRLASRRSTCGVFVKATGPCFLNQAFALAECSELLAAGRDAGGRGPGLPGRQLTRLVPQAPHRLAYRGVTRDTPLTSRHFPATAARMHTHCGRVRPIAKMGRGSPEYGVAQASPQVIRMCGYTARRGDFSLATQPAALSPLSCPALCRASTSFL